MKKTCYEVILMKADGTGHLAFPQGREEPFDTLGEAENFALSLTEAAGVLKVIVIRRQAIREYNGNDLIAELTKKKERPDER